MRGEEARETKGGAPFAVGRTTRKRRRESRRRQECCSPAEFVTVERYIIPLRENARNRSGGQLEFYVSHLPRGSQGDLQLDLQPREPTESESHRRKLWDII